MSQHWLNLKVITVDRNLISLFWQWRTSSSRALQTWQKNRSITHSHSCQTHMVFSRLSDYLRSNTYKHKARHGMSELHTTRVKRAFEVYEMWSSALLAGNASLATTGERSRVASRTSNAGDRPWRLITRLIPFLEQAPSPFVQSRNDDRFCERGGANVIYKLCAFMWLISVPW